MTSWCVPSPFGPLTLCARDGAIVSLRWGTAANAAPTPLLREAQRQLDAYFAGARTRFSLPLRPHGTPLQHRVWDAIAAIPYGRTATYGELARRIGTIARVVGAAAAANPLPIFIPCHRLIGSDGHLTGYSGGRGLATKAALLNLESPQLDL